MPIKFNDQVLVNSCMKNSHVITREPFTHESLLLDKREYQLSEREKNMAFRDYNHEKKYLPANKPTTYSQFYQRAQNYPAQSPFSHLYPAPPQLNPNINYSALVNYNRSVSSPSGSVKAPGFSSPSVPTGSAKSLSRAYNNNESSRDG
jgi:hypothetical protein